MKDNECKAYKNTYKCSANSCKGCGYRMSSKPQISIKDFVNLMYMPTKYTFYLDEKLVDLDSLYDLSNLLSGFEFEDGNVVLLYS